MLVSTHYMDEAERCHEIAYIAYGELLAQGTIDEVIAQSHLQAPDTVSGPDLQIAGREAARRCPASTWWRRSAPACTSPGAIADSARRGASAEFRGRPELQLGAVASRRWRTCSST